MKAKKLLAVLGVLVIAVPATAMAMDQNQITTQIVEGHTVFAAVLDETNTNFAAIAGIAAKRTTMGSVLWFNDQELIPASVANELAVGAFVIATEAGDDDPAEHLDAAYSESYQFTDPNNRVWIVDRYTYDVCTVDAGGGLHIVPCDADDAEEGALRQDLDGDNDDDLGIENVVQRTTKSIFVVEIGATTVDAASACGTGTGKEYNFVLLVRMDALGSMVDGGALHGASATETTEEGNSHAGSLTPAPDHAHDTAQIDLWFKEDRPPVPATGRSLMFPDDTIGDAAPCYAP